MIPNSNKAPLYFDIHSHLNFPQFDDDREDIIARMKEEDIWTITVGTDEKTSEEAVELSGLYENIFAAVGVHPTDLEVSFDENHFAELARGSRVVAIGECGLDYYRISADDAETKRKQRELFEKQINLAIGAEKPLMLHIRPSTGSMDAYLDGLSVLESFKRDRGDKLRGDVHFFVGDTEVAEKFLDLDCMMSFDGPITFSSDYDEVIRFIPLDRMMAETDAPFAAPDPYRGRRNEPSYVKEVVRAISDKKGIEYEEVRKILVENALAFFNIR